MHIRFDGVQSGVLAPRLLQAAKGVLVMPSPKFSDDELEYLLECLSPQAKAA